MGNDKDKLTTGKLIMHIIVLTFLIFSIPILMKISYGKFTWSFEKAQDYAIDRSFEELGTSCEFGVVSYGGRLAECQQAPCKTYNTDGKECVREGMTGGFFDTGIYYVCKDYGRMRRSCIDHFDNQEGAMAEKLCKENNLSFVDDYWGKGKHCAKVENGIITRYFPEKLNDDEVYLIKR